MGDGGVEEVDDCIALLGGGYYFWDDVNGKVLDWEGVRKARKDEDQGGGHRATRA